MRCTWAGTSLAIEALAACAYLLARLGRHAEAWTAVREELALLPFEPVSPTDLPETLVLRAERLEGLVAAALGQHRLALRRLASAEAGWRRLLVATPSGCCYAAARADLGAAPVGGLVEPGVELGRVLAERARLLAEAGRAIDLKVV